MLWARLVEELAHALAGEGGYAHALQVLVELLQHLYWHPHARMTSSLLLPCNMQAPLE